MDTAFFLLSKAFWLIARPETLLLMALFLGVLALLSGRRRLGAALSLGTLALCLAIGALPLHNLVLRPLEARFPVTPPLGDVEGIIVLGGAEDLTVSQVWGLPLVNAAGDRYLAAIALAQEHPRATLLFAGGGAMLDPDGAEAEISRQSFVSAGVAPDRVLLETRSRNTAENARNSRDLAPSTLTGDWVLVTSAFHMPRAVGTFCASGWSNIVPWPTDHRTALWRLDWSFAENLDLLNRGVREWIGLAAYRATGRSAALFPDGCP